MSYRKITVDGKDYEYTVGKTHLKIKGFDAVPMNVDSKWDEKTAVTPGRVTNIILALTT